MASLPAADPASGGHQALPVHTPARLQEAGEEADAPDADARLVALVRDCLKKHNGGFDPSWISHWQMGLAPRDERVHQKLNKLLLPGGLKAFVERHSDEFTWYSKADNKGMLITWAPGPPPPPEGDAPAAVGYGPPPPPPPEEDDALPPACPEPPPPSGHWDEVD